MKQLKCWKIVSVLGLLVLAIGLFPACGQNGQPGRQLPSNLKGELTTLTMAENFRTEKLPDTQLGRSAFNFVSLAEYDQNTILAAEYSDIIAINLKNPEESRMVIPPEDILVWNPTGIYYDQKEKLLYIANYTGRNILICSVEPDWKLQLKKEIRTDNMQSPENIALNPDRSRIAVADYNADRVFMLDQEGNLLWENELIRAHGIAIDEEAVYATGLAEACVVKYDYEGQLSERKGKLNPIGQDAYMWPTALSLYGDSLLLADAHAGRIIQLDKNLSYQTSVGCNGPAVNQLNYPYCVLPVQDQLIIADTFNSRLLFMDSTGVLSGQIIPGSMTTEVQASEEVPTFYQLIPYVYEKIDMPAPSVLNPLLESSDSLLVSSYSSLWLYSGGQQQAKIMLYDYGQLAAEPVFQQLYMTWIHPIEIDGHCIQTITGPQRTSFMYFFDESNKVFFTTRRNNIQGIWKTKNDLCSIYYPNPEKVIREQFLLGQESREQFLQLVTQGKNRREAYEEAFLSYYNKEYGLNFNQQQFSDWLNGVFTTEAGKAFLCSDMSTQAANDYFATLLESKVWYMSEIFLVRTFSGV